MTARRFALALALVGASVAGFGGGRATAHPSPAPVTVCRVLADGSVHAYTDPDADAVLPGTAYPCGRATVTEDDPRWQCRAMGNLTCGPIEGGA